MEKSIVLLIVIGIGIGIFCRDVIISDKQAYAAEESEPYLKLLYQGKNFEIYEFNPDMNVTCYHIRSNPTGVHAGVAGGLSCLKDN